MAGVDVLQDDPAGNMYVSFNVGGLLLLLLFMLSLLLFGLSLLLFFYVVVFVTCVGVIAGVFVHVVVIIASVVVFLLLILICYIINFVFKNHNNN